MAILMCLFAGDIVDSSAKGLLAVGVSTTSDMM